jgi:hypothetical protein
MKRLISHINIDISAVVKSNVCFSFLSRRQDGVLMQLNAIKFLFTKKHLNKILYNLHLENAANRNNLWHIIYLNIETTIQQKIKTK